jgi:hypothetical protein
MRTISEQRVCRTDVVLGWSSQIRGITRVLAAIVLFAVLHNPAHALQSVTLAWDPNVDNVAGYKVYYGVVSRTYTHMVDSGHTTSVTIPDLVEGTTYFFGVTAYNTDGLESYLSDEASYTVPGTIPEALAKLQIRAAPAGKAILTVSGEVGRTYKIQASPDFIKWTLIGTAVMPASGSLDFTDTNAVSFPKRFYRAE